MTVFRPARSGQWRGRADRAGRQLSIRVAVIDKEGFEVGHRLAAAGVTSFVLRYRLPAEGWDGAAEVPLQDAQRAMRLIRQGAASFGVDPKRICAMGFSAGGHVAASLATSSSAQAYAPVDEADRLDARPNLSALMYPVIDMTRPFAHAGSRTALLGASPTAAAELAHSPHRHVAPHDRRRRSWSTPTTIPAVPTENSLNYLAALRAAKVAAEGATSSRRAATGFGIGLAARQAGRRPGPDLFLAWAARRGFLGASASRSKRRELDRRPWARAPCCSPYGARSRRLGRLASGGRPASRPGARLSRPTASASSRAFPSGGFDTGPLPFSSRLSRRTLAERCATLATAYGPASPQRGSEPQQAEDRLHLNIWTPRPARLQRPTTGRRWSATSMFGGACSTGPGSGSALRRGTTEPPRRRGRRDPRTTA